MYNDATKDIELQVKMQESLMPVTIQDDLKHV